jgi:HemY protein
LKKRNAIDATLATQLRQQAWLEKIRAQTQSAAVHTLWKALPSELKPSLPLRLAAVQAFSKLNDPLSAHKLLVESLNAHWDSELIALVGELRTEDIAAQINQAERWLNSHPDDGGLLLALGKLCLQQELWGKAQNYLDASISLRPSRQAYTALARLAEKLEQHDTAFNYYHLAMALDEHK